MGQQADGKALVACT